MLRRSLLSVRTVLPAGHPLSACDWSRRHRVIGWVLGLHAAGLFGLALQRGYPLWAAFADVAPLCISLALAASPQLGRRVRSAVATLGVMGSSAVLVHLLDGLTEAHFHFFVMLFVIVFYQDWLTFLLAILFVLVEHAVVGVVASNMVYSHHAAQHEPVKWAGIHALFVTGAAIAAVANWRLTERAQQATLSATAQLAVQATRDQLTGALNRQSLELRVGEVLAAGDTGAQNCLCLVNLDRFKVLDEHTGDEVLRQVGRLLTAQAGPDALVARMSADRFGVLLMGQAPAAAVATAERLRGAIAERRFTVAERAVAVTVSIGVAPITPLAVGPGDVIQAAEAACHTAKDKGRNRVELYRADDDRLDRHRAEMSWAQRVIAALAENRLELYHQPIQRMRDDGGGHLGELLLRLREKDGTIVAPGLFLSAAARYDLLGALDRWVVTHAFRTLARHYPRTGAPAHPAAAVDLYFLNLSGPSIGDPAFLAHIRAQLNATGIAPQLICFEITESVAIEDLAAAARFITELRELGFRFALDDFGTGLSSFAYLKNLPVDFLKIDGNFVRGMVASAVDSVMVSAINDIGHNMNLRTIAEFVEDAHVLRRLHSIGVDFAQGYHLGLPGPLAEWLRAHRRRPAGTLAA